MRILVKITLLSLFPIIANGQGAVPDTTRGASHVFDPEAGQLLKRYVAPDAYGADRENWDATQDERGLFYVGNSDGVLIYDGHSWRLEPTANRTSVQSLARAENGTIFVGATGEFGAMRPDSIGRMRYVSLLDHVLEAHRSFGDVHRVVSVDGDVYFMSKDRLFRWCPDTESMTSWAVGEEQFTSLNLVRDTPYVAISGRGLATVVADTMRLVPGGTAFAEDRSITFSLHHPERGLIVGTLGGLFVRAGNSFQPFAPSIQDALQGAWVQTATLLPDGTIAVGTINEGVFLLAPDGTLRRRLPARDNPTLGLYVDREDGLWALQYGGMIRYDLAAPFTTHESDTGLEGTPNAIKRHRGTLHVPTNRSLYRLRTADSPPASVEALPAVARITDEVQCWTLQFEGARTLVGTTHGLAQVGPDDNVEHLTDFAVYDLIRDQADSTRYYAATNRGVHALRRTPDGWTSAPLAPDFEIQVEALEQENGNTLWTVSGQGVYRLNGIQSTDSTTVEQFGTEHGLPKGNIRLYQWQGKPVFGTRTGPMHFEAAPTARFVPLGSVEMPPGVSESYVYLSDGASGQSWGFLSKAGPGRWTRKDGVWRWRPGPLRRLRDENVSSMYVEENDGVVWFGTKDGRLVRYVPDAGSPPSPTRMRIRRVSTLEPDSTLTADGSSAALATLPFAHNSLRLTYGTPTLVQPDLVAYQHRLEGKEWSDWTARTEQVYRNLSAGPHTFSVRARTAYGDTTAAARYSFTVLPPWYRTWWAYGLYLLAAGGLVAGAVRWRTWQLRRRQATLEATVEERTQELQARTQDLAEAKQKTEQQAERLKELDEAKSRFFANVSHEFRTPLTLIEGPVRTVRERLERGAVEPEADADRLAVVERNTGRLLRLVDQLLGIARMEAGTYQLDARSTDVPAEVERITRPFEPLAERERLTLTVDTTAPPEEAPPVYLDREALEHILSNLLSNAIKFTPEGGTVTVTVSGTERHVQIAVADTGEGIPDAEQDAVFDRFRQIDGSATREQEGVGIGLAFASDLVDLHGGTITVESKEGEGTTFTVTMPRGREHLAEDQIVEPSAPSPASEEPTRPAVEAPDFAAVSPDEPAATNGAPLADVSSDPSSSSKVVLVVDDNDEVCQYVRSILEPAFSVRLASNGAEGLEVAREVLPDVVLADVMMPDMDGHEMTKQLKSDPETEAIPVIMVTARAGTGDEVTGLEVGADDYVTKPFNPNVLRQRVGGVITLQERLRRRVKEELQKTAADSVSDFSGDARSEVEQEARSIIRDHLTDPAFDVDALAEAMAVSRSTLYNRFSTHTETTPSALITEMRMEKATTLLREGQGSVTQVAYAVGYERLSSFSHAYKEHTGQSPSAVAQSPSS